MGDGSGQGQQQVQQQQLVDPRAQQPADLDALRRDQYGPREGMWFGAGPLVWWIKKAPAPGPLVTTGTTTGQGILGQPDTQILFGTDCFDFERFFGFQVHGGTWLNCLHNWGIEAGGFYLAQQSIDTTFASDSSGNPLLARPFNDAVTATPFRLLVASPGVAGQPALLTGSVSVHADSQFWGSEVNLIRNLTSCEDWHFDMLFGFRYLDLAENLRVVSASQSMVPGLLSFNAPTPQNPLATIPLSSLTVADRFFTRNQFYGGQIGGRFERWSGPFFLSLLGKVALGPNHESIKTFGFSQGQAVNGGVATQTGGLLAVGNVILPPQFVTPGRAAILGNIGRTTTNWFVVVPEVGVQAGVQMTEAIRVSLGYNFLFINSVARPGSQVNPTINRALVPSDPVFGSASGPNQPAVSSKQETFFAHGALLNLELCY